METVVAVSSKARAATPCGWLQRTRCQCECIHGNWALPADCVFTIIRTGLLQTHLKGALNMNRKELIDALAAKTESTKADAERNVGAMIDIISDTLKKGDSLSLVGFGTFEVRKRAARTGRNPKTGEALKIKAAKVPAFKAGATLKAAVNGTKKK